MAQFIPKFVAQEAWEKMTPQQVYGIKLSLDELVRFRFGIGLGVYVEISRASQGYVINMLDFETGDPTLAGKLTEGTVVVGRTSECQVKIAQPIMSRQHLELKVWDNKVLIAKDMGSLNGTYMWKEIPIVNLTEQVVNADSIDLLSQKFGIDAKPLLNEYSQNKGS